MSTIDSSRRQTDLDIARDAPRDGVATRVFLQPIAAPSILGLFGFAGATFIVASNLAGWWGTPESGLALAPFAAMFGGLAQFLAGMWARNCARPPNMAANGASTRPEVGVPHQPARLDATMKVAPAKPKRPRIDGAAIG